MSGTSQKPVFGVEQMNKFRRKFLAGVGLAGAAALGSGILGVGQSEADATLITSYGPAGAKKRVTDIDIGNFALNLEYLEAQFYLYAANGTGLAASETTGVGTAGTVTGGKKANLTIPAVQQYAADLARDERNHVLDLRMVLGGSAVAMPNIDIGPAFSAAAIAAGIIPNGTFDPYASDANFLLGAFVFEDVGVTAYNGAAPYVRNTSILAAAAGILGVEAYHAGSIRTALFQLATSTNTPSIIDDANKITILRATADGDAAHNGHETPLTDASGAVQIVAADPTTSIAYSRTFQEVLQIVYLGNAPGTGGGFFPNGVNGLIK